MNIKQIKENFTCLDYLGDRVVKKTRNGYLARAPWRQDKHPSLSITPDGRGWHDLATGAKGSVIDLVMAHLNTHDFKRVVEELTRLQPNSSSFYPQIISDGGKEKDLECSRFGSFNVVPLQSRGLYAYLHRRKVNIDIAKQFLKEAHYSFQDRNDGRYLYALAYPNDLGGYELRGAPYKGNPNGFKGSTAPKGITTHLIHGNAPVIVFEGFIDMLSFATLCGGVKHNYIVLNSIVNAQAAVDMLRAYRNTIYISLDNDGVGRETARRMLEQLSSARDISYRFAPAKDVNEYLCHF